MHLQEHSFSKPSQTPPPPPLPLSKPSQTPPPLPLQAFSESAQAKIREERREGFRATQEAIKGGDVIASPVLANFLKEQLALDNPETNYNFLIKIHNRIKEKIKSVFYRN